MNTKMAVLIVATAVAGLGAVVVFHGSEKVTSGEKLSSPHVSSVAPPDADRAAQAAIEQMKKDYNLK